MTLEKREVESRKFGNVAMQENSLSSAFEYYQHKCLRNELEQHRLVSYCQRMVSCVGVRCGLEWGELLNLRIIINGED